MAPSPLSMLLFLFWILKCNIPLLMSRKSPLADVARLFLYLLLGGGFIGTIYFIYNTWAKAFFTPQRQPRSKRERKATVPSAGLSSGDEKATTTGAKGYDESWIPANHLNRPEARRIRSGTPKTKAK
jgi:hypothetical protein